MIRIKLMGLILALSVAVYGQPADSQTLRSETKVYLDGPEPTLISETLTLFNDGIVYDVQMPDKNEVTVFDIPRERIILMDRRRKVRATINPDDLISYMDNLKQYAMQHGKADLFGIHGAPDVDPTSGIYRVGFPGLLYSVQTQRLEPKSLARSYNEFSMWANRLNVYHHPGGAPFARLELTRKMSEDGVIPRTVTRQATRDREVQVIRSEHVFGTLLSQQDQALIHEIGGMIVTFNDVTHAEFRRPQVAQGKP